MRLLCQHVKTPRISARRPNDGAFVVYGGLCFEQRVDEQPA